MTLVDSNAQIIALIINGLVMLLLAAIGYFVRRAYITIRDSLHRLEDVQERITDLETSNSKRDMAYQQIRDELFYLKGKLGVPIDQPVTGIAEGAPA